jgi:ATP-binding cassette subfamily B protein
MLGFFKYLKPYIIQLGLLVFLVFGTVAAALQLPDYMAEIINKGIVRADDTFIFHSGLLMLLIALGGAFCTVGAGYLASWIATSLSRDIRNKVFARVESFSLVEFNRFSTASLITRSTNDVQQIQTVMVLLLRMVLQAPITGIWAIFKAYSLSPSLSWIIVLAVIVLFGVILLMFSITLPKFKLLQEFVDRLNLATRENLTGLRVIRAFNREKAEQDKFEKANLNLTTVNLFINRLMAAMHPAMMLIMNLTAVFIVWIGARMIDSDNLEIGNMIAFMQYAMQAIMSFLMISMIFIMAPRASVSAGRINEIIETELTIKDPEFPEKIEHIHNVGVEFKNVTFYYAGADTAVLENISFRANPGEITAFIGSTGSGKSTLINLILRFYDVNSGKILLNGIDIRRYRLEDLYKKIGYVPQKSVLFSGTIKSNIIYGCPEATEDKIKKYSEISQSAEFIDNFAEKFATLIAQGGVNISGGQKQRLSIARAIIKLPEVYIFDDSFSALDFQTEANLRQSLQGEISNKTVLIVAQRISTIMSAEKIIVLDNGGIACEGNHEYLLKNCSVYREIAYSQLTEEELRPYHIDIEKENSEDGKKGGRVR